MKKHLFTLVLLLIVRSAFTQSYNPTQPPNTYQNSDNPQYWKNRKPHAAYWQQDVHYTIKANIDETTDIVSGSEKLIYTNNSPDELTYVYFHLYANAMVKGSYMENLAKNNGEKPSFGRYMNKGLGIEILKMQQNNKELKVELDNTILKVYLDTPVKPGQSITFDIDFKTYFDQGGLRRRMKKFNSYGYTHYDGVHWYPRISVYDAKFGWDTYQHLGKEFYGDFGAYDVELTFSDNYVVEATGFLLNKDEVLPDSLRKKLDIKNFATKPWNSSPSVITRYNKNNRKTWKYHSENTHDFAFTADPNYRIGETYWKGIQIVSLALEPHASGWQNAADYTAKVIECYSRDFGMYVYNKMVVADAQDGMEYPMLTLDGGSDPDYRGLLAHEVGHNWFFGMVGNNETYRAFLDEGFTQFLTSWSQERIDGKYVITPNIKSAYTRKFKDSVLVRDQSVFNGYMRDAIRGEDGYINTISDGFNGALNHDGGYRQVYSKTATMLYNLEYVLGDSLFIRAMRNYFNQWKICHPYPEDFRNSIIQYTKTDLNWFFDQWLETDKRIDYSVNRIKKNRMDGTATIYLKREGRMQMPLDLRVISKKDSVYDFLIPNTWFVKETNATLLPKWFGWDKIQPEYKAVVKIPGGIKDVIIDPSNRLADVYMPDNRWREKTKLSFDSRVYNAPDWKQRRKYIRPDLWYNAFDGIKAGVHMNGNFFNYTDLTEVSLWYNTGLGAQNVIPNDSITNNFDKISVTVNLKFATDKLVKYSSINYSSRVLDGLFLQHLGIERKNKSQNDRFYTYFKMMYRDGQRNLKYLIMPTQWDANKWNNTMNVGYDHVYRYRKGSGKINVHLKSSSLGSDYDFSQLTFSVVNKNVLGKFDFNTRVFAQLGTGSNLAKESALYFAGANPEEMMENKYTRSAGIMNTQQLYGAVTQNYQFGGGLNMRGYNGYLIQQFTPAGSARYLYSGSSGAAFNAELGFDRLFSFIRPKYIRDYIKINTYLFGDAGIIDYKDDSDKMKFSDVRFDAGAGATLTIKKWGPVQMVQPLVLRFDVPLFLNAAPDAEEFVQFRWVFGISRAF